MQGKKNKIDLLKIDTECFERNVLNGAELMLQRDCISFLYCETGFQKTNQRDTYFPELTEHLSKCDYYFFGFYQWIATTGKVAMGLAMYCISIKLFFSSNRI